MYGEMTDGLCRLITHCDRSDNCLGMIYYVNMTIWGMNFPIRWGGKEKS